ncbi:MAG TPA: fluoride efflux transporter CrcB [Candidatus Polarisedimenticolia bacterium]|nr:fluoride efflux transporter CrcB [Candidatus Polarisedimenticolia bacterium]
MLIRALLVGAGGAIGSMARYLLSGAVHRLLDRTLFPAGTLAVNVAGCLLIGFLGGLAETRGVLTAETRLLLMIGCLGGFTTFSSFGYETFQLARDGQATLAAMNVGLQIGLGLLAVWGGEVLSRIA